MKSIDVAGIILGLIVAVIVILAVFAFLGRRLVITCSNSSIETNDEDIKGYENCK